MNTPFKFLLTVIIGFTILSGALEVYRIINTTLIIEEDTSIAFGKIFS